jgi:hypothetical protein
VSVTLMHMLVLDATVPVTTHVAELSERPLGAVPSQEQVSVPVPPLAANVPVQVLVPATGTIQRERC